MGVAQGQLEGVSRQAAGPGQGQGVDVGMGLPTYSRVGSNLRGEQAPKLLCHDGLLVMGCECQTTGCMST